MSLGNVKGPRQTLRPIINLPHHGPMFKRRPETPGKKIKLRSEEPRIVNGTEARKNQFPHQVLSSLLKAGILNYSTERGKMIEVHHTRYSRMGRKVTSPLNKTKFLRHHRPFFWPCLRWCKLYLVLLPRKQNKPNKNLLLLCQWQGLSATKLGWGQHLDHCSRESD